LEAARMDGYSDFGFLFRQKSRPRSAQTALCGDSHALRYLQCTDFNAYFTKPITETVFSAADIRCSYV
jgi:hypothetical protein